MKLGFLRLLALLSFLAVTAGCHTTLEGRLKPGVPFARDTMVSRYERPYQEVYAAAKWVLQDSGTLVSDDQVTRVLRAKIAGNTVWVSLDDSEPKMTTISVQARTGGGATNLDLANEVDKRIYGRLIVNQ